MQQTSTVSQVVLACDLGGTKSLWALVRDGKVLATSEFPTGKKMNFPSFLAATSHALEELLNVTRISPYSISSLAMAVPGPVNRRERIIYKLPNLPALEGIRLDQELEKAFGLPVYLSGDTFAALLGEINFGSAEIDPLESTAYLTISTGIGVAVRINGYIFDTEIGHMTIDRRLRRTSCACGAPGCWEYLAAGPSYARFARHLVLKGNADDLVEFANGREIDAKLIGEAADANVYNAQFIIRYQAQQLEIGVRNVINTFMLDHLIIGGGVSELGEKLLKPVRDSMKATSMRKDVNIIPSTLGRNVGILGAAALPFYRE